MDSGLAASRRPGMTAEKDPAYLAVCGPAPRCAFGALAASALGVVLSIEVEGTADAADCFLAAELGAPASLIALGAAAAAAAAAAAESVWAWLGAASRAMPNVVAASAAIFVGRLIPDLLVCPSVERVGPICGIRNPENP